jgi:hypothetical protein
LLDRLIAVDFFRVTSLPLCVYCEGNGEENSPPLISRVASLTSSTFNIEMHIKIYYKQSSNRYRRRAMSEPLLGRGYFHQSGALSSFGSR